MTQRTSHAAAARLAVLLGGAGVLHFVTPQFFDMQVPRALPGKARTYTQVSGIAELAVAGAVAVPATRRLGGGLAAALFIAVFPANIDMARRFVSNPKTSPVVKAAVLARLPLQIPLVTEALKVRRLS
ncbi:hypothetical protein [Rhodococcus sp. 14-2470-1a]|uniref:DoxX family protein n=1 Tax=Rhodococcus sp. 14-2470-1a TaxID=2023150 RepID=UPI00037D97D9|nr:MULTISPECIES: hypothetical protein [unclassified Rhodococcus (in: high G+C Gram-positive bacteria)]OZC62291.1 hypothetical protein CH267_01785 [Rhodococcus sp. 06-621-2]OZD67232.1 hypothetical protein CH263_11385 [Rhodococcus sp. 06-1059B-a]OZE88100.1 hypothetical protein CH304_00590 [Rhodococcus sp. 15-649-1-2]OZE97568.1 hypothetical protein CH300_25615 [Rhodococcus sp. 15-1154-1]OZF58234.1 hypothetical protein CH292_00320 [Rhodococcus sp. 14-2470-1a]